MEYLHTKQIRNGRNVRRDLDDSVLELAESIRSVHAMSDGTQTLLQPIAVRPLDEPDEEGYTHEIVYGQRRHAAMLYLSDLDDARAWSSKVPVVVLEHATTERTTAMQLIENLQREDMSLLDEAVGLALLLKQAKLDQKRLAQTLGKSPGWVSQRLAILRTADAVQAGIVTGLFGQAHVREFSRLSKSQQTEVAEKLMGREEVTVVDVRRAVDALLAGPKPPKEKKAPSVEPDAAGEEGEEGGEGGEGANEPDEETPAKPITVATERSVVLQSLSHEEKVAFLHADSARREARKRDLEGVAARAASKVSKLEKSNGNPAVRVFLQGALAGVKYALGTEDSIPDLEDK